MFRRAMYKLMSRALLIGGAVVVGRWAFGTVTRSLSAPYTAAALQAGRELFGEQRRVLIIARRLSDIEQYLGGTLQLLQHNGSHVAVAILADDDAVETSGVVEGSEMTQEVGIISASPNLYKLNLVGNSSDHTVFDALKELVEHVKPNVVLVDDPEGAGFYPGIDQVTAGDVVLNLVQAGVLADARIYFYGSRHTNVLVDTSGLAYKGMTHTEALCRIV